MPAVLTKMAFPLMHITAGDYAPFAGAYRFGRPYRQPVQSLADKNDFASGIEMFFDNSNAEVQKLYCPFPCSIIWKNGQLILSPEPDVIKAFVKVKLIEGMLGRIIFENASPASVSAAIAGLINAAYSATVKDHPVLKLNFKSTNKTILQELNAAPDAAKKQELIQAIATAFIGATPFKLMVNAGDYIGNADAFQATDVLPPVAERPAWMKTAADADRARRITIITKDVGRQYINPFYYLHKYAATQTVITANKANHPLLSIAAPQFGRAAVNGIYYLPFDHLTTFHGFPSNDPDSLANFPAPGPDKNQWRYTDAAQFEAQPKNVTVNASERAKFNKIKSSYFADLKDFCEKTQVPIELIMGQIGAESSGEPGVVECRLEPLQQVDINNINDWSLVHKYNKLIGFHCKAYLVTKVEKNFKFLLERNEGIGKISPTGAMGVDVLQLLYMARDKYYVSTGMFDKDLPRVKTVATIPATRLIGGLKGKQAAGKKLYYSFNEQMIGKETLADAEKPFGENGVFHFNPGREERKVFSKKPTLDGDTTFTVLLNGAPTELTFVLKKEEQTISDTALFDKKLFLTPTDKLCISIETAAGTGEIENAKLNLVVNPKYEVTINEVYNKTNPTFGLIKAFRGGMNVAEELGPGVTKYYPVNALSAGKVKKEEVAAYKVTEQGFILISDAKTEANALARPYKISVLKRASATAAYQPTSITLDLSANKLDIPISVPVVANEEVILEITTAADADAARKMKGFSLEFNFVPFNNDEAFLVSQHGYEINLLAADRSDPTKPVSTVNGRQMTWNELYSLFDKSGGTRVSIGPNQFLISNALFTVQNSGHILPSLIPEPFPTRPTDYIEVLMDKKKELALSVASARYHYNFSPVQPSFEAKSTQFDLPLVGSAHNAFRANGMRIKRGKGIWGVHFAKDEYVFNAGPIFNLAQENYNDSDFKPSVCFKK